MEQAAAEAEWPHWRIGLKPGSSLAAGPESALAMGPESALAVSVEHAQYAYLNGRAVGLVEASQSLAPVYHYR